MCTTQPSGFENKPGIRAILSAFGAIARFIRQGRSRFQRPIDGSGQVSMDNGFADINEVRAFLVSIEDNRRKLIAAPASGARELARSTPDDGPAGMTCLVVPATPDTLVPSRVTLPSTNASPDIASKALRLVRGSVFQLRLSDALILLAIAGGLSMSKGEPVPSEPNTAVVGQPSRDGTDNGNSRSTAQPEAATNDGTKFEENKAPVQAAAPVVDAPAAKADSPSQASGPVTKTAPEPKSEKAAAEPAKEGLKRGHEIDQSLAKSAAHARASTGHSNERAGHQRLAHIAVMSPAEKARLLDRAEGGVDYRSWRADAADVAPRWIGPPPIVYGRGPVASAPMAAESPSVDKKQDRLPSEKPGILQQMVNAPGAVLRGGRQVFYDILDTVW